MTTATAPARADTRAGAAEAPAPTSFDAVWQQLEAWGSESVRRSNAKAGAGENQFGVMMGKLRPLAAQLQKEPAQAHTLALRLWQTGNADAMLLASMLLDPAQLDEAALEMMMRPLTYTRVLDELAYNVVAQSPHAATLRERWMDSPEEYLGRAGWQLTNAAVTDPKAVKAARRAEDGLPPGLDLDRLLGKIEAEVRQAPLHKQESMTQCLVMIATHYDAYTQRCIALGEQLGRYDTRPVPKGCTAWYAPEWIAAVLKRRK
jgi:hypothetical protein